MRKKQNANIRPDLELEEAVQRAIRAGIPLSRICAKADINQATLWKWRTQKASPVMSVRQDVLDAINALLEDHKNGASA